ncbi:putative death-receptor fusion protein-domain-containing protein [Chaetomidium leptoderma]|uniref:Death-receptor fusion protein-domain-containing protein n=1 Tax=Chaetomidium leptoderma TaxID=669021 RepID=A0AAN6ZT86_9PEZI|nr:putative death-receptor fusion protein-domain-containing protein [Chaetomidium leptoderma]
MEVPRDILDGAEGPLAGVEPSVFENANTITKWLLSQPEDTQPQLAEAIFQKLLQDASQSRQYHGNGHACVRLCSFVQLCAKSNDKALKQWAFTEALSTKLFHFYLEWYEHDPHRALRLVLDVLVASTTSNPSPETGKAIKAHVLESLVSIIARKSAQQLTKSGLQCLDHLLNKRVVDLTDIALEYRAVEPSVADLPSLLLWRAFAFHLFSWMELTYVCPLAGKCLVHMFQGLDTASQDTANPDSAGFTLEVWREWLQCASAQNPEILEGIKNYVLAPVFKTNRDASLRLLEMFNRTQPLSDIDHDMTDQGLLLQLATLEIGKKYGLVEEPSSVDGVSQQSTTKTITLQGDLLDKLLAHPSVSVRSSAFSLLVSSQSTTKPFSEVAFNLLKKHLASFHADYDAKIRNDVLGHTKNLVKRAKNIITVAQRSFAAHQSAGDGVGPPAKKKFGPEIAFKDASEARGVLTQHESFLAWYMGFLKNELLPTASYQRHITAVKAAVLLLRVGKHAGATDEATDEDMAQLISSDFTWVRLLLDLLLDPFDDVRDGAATLLTLLPPNTVEPDTTNSPDLLKVLRDFCVRAGKLSDRTGRADHGDGAARSQGLLCSWLRKPDSQVALLSEILSRVESKISKAEDDLGHAAIESPVHADFAAISYVWQVLAKQTYSDSELDVIHHLQRRIFFCARQIWLTIKHVLCDDSPEGHLPEELEDIEGLDTKDLLSYSFRAVHESSNLLRLLVGTLRLRKAAGVPYPPLDVFRETGYLTFEQLATLRHRGAFSTVSHTFANCCQLTQQLKDAYPDIDVSENLLREWYQGAIDCIMTQASTTRRSAGIPSLIAAVLMANAASPSFDEVYGTLEEIGKKSVRMSETDGSNLPQVHALNSLRDIFRSSLLSKKAEGYLARTLHLATNSLRSEVWAIRNCGLLLLRSLIDCLLGTGESKASIESGWDGHSVRISYNKYPTLPGVILGLLRSADETLDQAAQSGAAEAVFPALDIIRRAGPPDEHRSELRKHIEGYLGSRLWHVREIAARTLCSFLLQEDWTKEIGRLLTESGTNTNRLHGTLLTARFVVERKVDLGVDLKSDSASVEALLEELSQRQLVFKHCAELQAACLEILNLLASHGCHEQAAKAVMSRVVAERSGPSSALLDLHTSLKVVYDAVSCGDVDGLRAQFLKTLKCDVNTAARMLELIPKAWKQVDSASARPGLCRLYLDACTMSSAPEVRTQALINLGSLMDNILSRGQATELPSVQQLDGLWGQLQEGDINPTLSCAIVETSGTIMAVLVSRDSGMPQNMDQRLSGWGDMLSECLDVDNSFDTRYAAAVALRSFFMAAKSRIWGTQYLPVLSALYSSLIDDDDEVRAAAANAASSVIGTPAVAPAAANGLVPWLQEQFGESEAFRSRVVYRMVGQSSPSQEQDGRELIPAEDQLRRALDFDDSLFAAEEQNLFIDEVRETTRWRGAFDARSSEASLGCLRTWVEAGLKCLIGLAKKKEDGPLGWTSDQHVFAVCARILLCAVAITKTGGGEEDTGVGGLLQEFREVGGKARIHGSLLEMSRLETEA